MSCSDRLLVNVGQVFSICIFKFRFLVAKNTTEACLYICSQ